MGESDGFEGRLHFRPVRFTHVHLAACSRNGLSQTLQKNTFSSASQHAPFTTNPSKDGNFLDSIEMTSENLDERWGTFSRLGATESNVMPNAPQSTSPSETTGTHRMPNRSLKWFIAFLFFPYGPFIYLTWRGALRWPATVVLLLASVVIHPCTVLILSKTNDQPWQPWIVLLMGVGMYCLGLIQFVIGERKGIWSPTGRRVWTIYGWFFGLVLLLFWTTQVVNFYLGS